QIGPLGDLRDGADGEALLLGLGGGLRALAQAHADLDAAVAQVQRVGMALGAEADDSDLLALDDGQVGVVVVEDLSHDVLLRCGVRATGRSYRPVSYVVRVGLWMWDAGAVDAARGQDSRLRSVIARPPRPMATWPDFTISRMPKDSSIPSSAVSLSCVPVASMVTESAAASTTFARNICTISSTGVREELSAVTLMRMSSRWTVERASSWTIFSTFTSLLSCLVICSRRRWSTSTTTVMREISGCSVGPTASEEMLYPRRENSAVTRVRTPGLFSTSTESVWLSGVIT